MYPPVQQSRNSTFKDQGENGKIGKVEIKSFLFYLEYFSDVMKFSDNLRKYAGE